MQQHIERWLGLLGSGLVEDAMDEEAVDAAISIVGEEPLSQLREWISQQPHAVIQELDATVIEVCIWMTQADGVTTDDERAHIERLIEASRLDTATEARVRQAWTTRPHLTGLTERLPHPVLRELLLVLAWQTAHADGQVTRGEQGGEVLLSALLGVPDERAYALRRALGSISRLPPAPVRAINVPKPT